MNRAGRFAADLAAGLMLVWLAYPVLAKPSSAEAIQLETDHALAKTAGMMAEANWLAETRAAVRPGWPAGVAIAAIAAALCIGAGIGILIGLSLVSNG